VGFCEELPDGKFASASVSSHERKEAAMICSNAFQGNAGDRFGLRVVDVQNVTACTVVVLVGNGGGSHELNRFGLHELENGVDWELEGNATYTILMQVLSQAPGEDASVQVEIPIGSQPSDCSRMSSGIIGSWRVDVF
jgi:hypothetical protein